MKRLLVIRPGALGDALLALPVLQALRVHMGLCHITFVSNGMVIPLARECALADEVSDYNASQWSQLFSEKGITSPSLQLLLTDVEWAICWLRDSEGIVARNLFAAGCLRVTIAPGRPQEGEEHIVHYLARTIGVKEPELCIPFDTLQNFAAKHTISEPLRPQLDYARSARPVVVHPGSGSAKKCWPVAYFADVIITLQQRAIPVIVTGGPADEQRLPLLQQQLSKEHAPIPPMIQDTPLLADLLVLMQACCGYLGNDTGITHLAAMAGLPTLVLFGPTSPKTWYPPGPHVVALQDVDMTRLLPVDVIKLLFSILRLNQT